MNKQNKNIALIGMTGSGKTTISRLLSQKLNCEYIDVDDYIKDKYNQSSAELFKQGDDYFRCIEHQSISEIVDLSPRIIATGGGVVERKGNMELLKKDRVIIFLNRPVDSIMKDMDLSRPLFKKDPDRLYKIFDKRYNLYKDYSDIEILNDGAINEAVDKLIHYLTNM
ncbi:MAG: shikimate kinase [Tissierellaceae bacterium]|nr:shikimate kinase [Tissierellaceae bacterium]